MLASQAAISLETAGVYGALRESEELNRLTLSNLTDAVFVTDDTGSFIYICPNVDIIFGYSYQEMHDIGNIDFILGKGLFAPTELEASQKLINIEREITDKDGRIHSLLVSVVRVLIKGGTRLYTCRDVTERKRVEDALRKSEAEYRRLVDTANEGIWVLGPDTITTFVNAQMAEMLALTAEEMLGRPVTDFMFEEDVPDHLNKMENRRHGISEHYERRYRRKDGKTLWTLAAATPIFDSEHRFRGSFAMLTDITERKQAEEREKDFYRLTILAATEGKLQLTEQGEIKRIAGPAKAVFPAASADDFRSIRTAVMEIARSLGMDELRAGDYRVAVGEAVTNATKHAGSGIVSIHILPEAILTVVSDQGAGIEAMSIPRVALEKGYTTAGTLGMGYKVMIAIADKVYLATGPWGTIVGIEMRIRPSEAMLDISDLYRK
jgi:PAS domain S-box-containing protein